MESPIFAVIFFLSAFFALIFIFVLYAETSSSTNGAKAIIHKIIKYFFIFLLVLGAIVFVIDYFSENFFSIPVLVPFILVLLSPSAFGFFVMRPRQRKLNQKFSKELMSFRNAEIQVDNDIKNLISNLHATDSEVYHARLIAKKKESPDFCGPKDNPYVVNALVPFMKKQEALSFPEKEEFIPTSFHRRIFYTSYFVIVLLLSILLFCIFSELYRETDSLERDSSVSDISNFSLSNDEYAYVASVNSDKFHIPSCRHAANISDENQVYYSTRSDARSDGKSPCSVCDP